MRRNDHMGTNSKFQQVTYIPFSCLDRSFKLSLVKEHYRADRQQLSEEYSTQQSQNTNSSQKLMEHSIRHTTLKSTNQVSKHKKEKKFLNALSVTRETTHTSHMLEM